MCQKFNILQQIEVRPIRRDEISQWQELMQQHHYLGFAGLVGERIQYVATLDGKWVALLAWAASALKIKPRDQWIGWNWKVQLLRLKFVVNNSRFLILPGQSFPNLASRVLALNLRRLSADFQTFYGHPVFLAETFVDSSRFRGTCYLAAGWQKIGVTRGFSRKGNGYVANGNAQKSIFVKYLCPNANDKLANSFRDPINPKEKIIVINYKKLPIEGKGGLIDVLKTIQDPRSKLGMRHSFISILAIAACATLSGCRSYTAIADWSKKLSIKDLKKLRSWQDYPPSETVIRQTLQLINGQEFDEKVGAWLLKQSAFQKGGIAIDGKTLRGSHDGDLKAIQLLSVFLHHEQVTIAQKQISDKTNEIPVLREILEPMDIRGSVVTADALHSQSETGRFIVKDKGAEFNLIVKDNQPTLRSQLEANLGSSVIGAFPPSAPNN
jgi:hypothetical protein